VRRNGPTLKFWLIVGPVFLLVLTGFLIGPRAPADRQAEFCVVNVHIAGPFGISLNCDSPEFMQLARRPSALLEPENTRQSRPGMVLAAAALAWPLKPFASLANKAGIRANRTDIEQERINSALETDFPFYTAYIVLNIVILLLSFVILRKSCLSKSPKFESVLILSAMCFFLMANDVVKAFVWSPHTQMFNIFVPLFGVWASVQAANGALRNWRFTLYSGLLTGLGATAYPLFVIVLPCVLVSGATSVARHSTPIGTFVRNGILFALLTILPEATWYAFVRYETGAFFIHDIQQGHLRWIAEIWQNGIGALAIAWLRKFLDLVALALEQMLALGVLMTLITVLAIANWRKFLATSRNLVPIFLCTVLVSLTIGAFYATTGLIDSRLAYALIPPLVLLLSATAVALAEADTRWGWVLAVGCVAISMVHSVAVVVKSGPFS
jgi:hypothetical protein